MTTPDGRGPDGAWYRVPRIGRQRGETMEDTSLHALLEQLGDTPDEVAQTLRDQNCKGPQYNDCFCPVARFISKHTGQAASATSHACAIGDFTYCEDGTIDTFEGREWARTPEPVARMITAYDRGAYEFLRD